ncbi:MAG: hypothetical protein LC749_18085, partial [Actinobacteria bacterium]|nr:hypothetical protein [Actinomycetota bacterium]
MDAMDPGASPSPTRAGLDSAVAWRNVGAAFLAMFTVFGVAYSFGEFFRPMAREFGAGRSAAAAVFSI